MADIRTAFETPSLTLATVKAIVKQSLLALDYLHAKCGIIHCGRPLSITSPVDLKNVFDADIKPGNILLKTGTNSLSSRVMDLSTTNIITDAAQPPSQPLSVDPLALADPHVTIADFGHGRYSYIYTFSTKGFVLDERVWSRNIRAIWAIWKVNATRLRERW